MWIFPSLGVSGERGLDLQSLDELWTPFGCPGGFSSDGLGVVEFRGGLALFSYDHDSYTSTLDGSGGEEADTAVASSAKVDSVGGCGGKVARGDPVDGRGEDLLGERGGEGSGGSQVGA